MLNDGPTTAEAIELDSPVDGDISPAAALEAAKGLKPQIEVIGVQALRFRTNQDQAKWKAAVKDHERMLDALG